jgi:hypothetical protein
LPKYSYPIILSLTDDVQDYNDGFGTNSGMDIFLNTKELNQITETEILMETIHKKIKA